MPSATIIDYKVGNIFSMNQALVKAGFSTSVTSDYETIKKADAIILPGVGNFGVAAGNLQPLKNIIIETVETGVPMLGSCLGMQLLLERSEEGDGDGLGLIKGDVIRFRGDLKTPHMGWNTIKMVKDSPILKGIEDQHFYFVHSYYAKPIEKRTVIAATDYGGDFTSIIGKGNIIGTQFHPEKSGEAGAKLLSNFRETVKR